ncbi:MAG: hypothetical protein HRU29_16195 [Rhizobiales bacterium]|nr:hypothetical protein [Hyphomicrobiales bacterium]NRB15934.1 hypothetical protein [Hyphomicrobiales bacterium]
MSEIKIVDHNLRLVEYFISEFYTKKTWELSHIASPTFVFDLNDGEPMDFAEYAESMKRMYSVATIKFGDLKAAGTEQFVANWVMSMKTDRAEMDSGSGYTEFTVERGLLQNVSVFFDIKQYVFQYYGELQSAEI